LYQLTFSPQLEGTTSANAFVSSGNYTEAAYIEDVDAGPDWMDAIFFLVPEVGLFVWLVIISTLIFALTNL
jgi:hypothetical protein